MDTYDTRTHVVRSRSVRVVSLTPCLALLRSSRPARLQRPLTLSIVSWSTLRATGSTLWRPALTPSLTSCGSQPASCPMARNSLYCLTSVVKVKGQGLSLVLEHVCVKSTSLYKLITSQLERKVVTKEKERDCN